MINTQELRKGNYILFNGEHAKLMGIQTRTVLLDGVMRQAADGIAIEYNPISAREEALQPLPLSDFLLGSMRKGKFTDNFGIQHQYHGSNSTYTIRCEEEGYYVAMFSPDRPIHITPAHLHYLHQLQNIHFAQYGEDIDIKEGDVKLALRKAKNSNLG